MSEESESFINCKKAINRLLLEEKRLKKKLEKLQIEKIKCVRVLCDNKYCKEILEGKE